MARSTTGNVGSKMMAEGRIQISRYPNRRFYSRHSSQYVSLQDIESMVQAGQDVEIRDSQTDEDLTRPVLTRILLERQPEKMLLFPTAMLHFILRSNDQMTDFLRDYFRHSLTYLDYLQRHSATATPLTQPMHWVKAWLDSVVPSTAGEADRQESPDPLALRIEQLEARLRQLEGSDAQEDQEDQRGQDSLSDVEGSRVGEASDGGAVATDETEQK